MGDESGDRENSPVRTAAANCTADMGVPGLLPPPSSSCFCRSCCALNASISSTITSRWAARATCNGVKPAPSTASGLAPEMSSISTMSRAPLWAAMCIAVTPDACAASNAAPAATRREHSG